MRLMILFICRHIFFDKFETLLRRLNFKKSGLGSAYKNKGRQQEMYITGAAVSFLSTEQDQIFDFF